MRRNPGWFLFLLLVLSASAATAQPGRSGTWSGYLAAGPNFVMGDAGDALDDGFELHGGALYRPSNWPLAVLFEAGYNNQQIRREVFGDFQGRLHGNVSNWSLGVGPMLELGRNSPVGFYVVATAGFYRRDIDLTTPSVGFVPPTCSRWYPWCSPGGWVPLDRVVARDTTTAFGYSAGAGLTFSLSHGTQLFLEARYHRVQTSPEPTEFVPISFGLRF